MSGDAGDDDVPTVVAGRYRVRRMIGRGGFGSVYLARDEGSEHEHGVDVAIKFVPLKSARLAQQFQHEARALGALAHPNIVKVLDVWQDERRGALVMEYVPGSPLSTKVGEAGLPLEDAINYVLPVCDALEHAHHRNVIHRDVTPRNIVVTDSDGAVKLIDFGFSVSEFSGERAPGGTRAYAAPEQFTDAATFDRRSDVYGVGAVIHLLVTGRSLGANRTPSLICSPPGVTLRAALPPSLTAVLLKAINPDPERRYQSMRELGEALRGFLRTLSGESAREAEPAAPLAVALVAPERVPPVGRNLEVEQLSRCLSNARDGHGRVATISGASGSGKSRVVSRFVEDARAEGALVIRGACLENGQSAAYGAFREALAELDPQCRGPGDGAFHTRARLTRAAAGREADVLRLAPWLRDLLEGPEGPGPQVETDQRQFLWEFRQFLTALGEPGSPVVVWLDDVQWADASTLRVVEWLAMTVETKCCVIALSYREDGRSRIEQVLQAATRRVHVSIEPLTVAQISDLLPTMVGCSVAPLDTAARLVADASGGNAFAVWEVCRGLADSGAFVHTGQGTATFDVEQASRLLARFTPADILSVRLAKLPPSVRNALGRASVWGKRFTRGQAGLTDEAGRMAVDFGLLACDRDDTLVFTHDRVREAARALLSPEESQQLQRLAGEDRRKLEATRALAVEHFVSAGDFDLASRVAVEAAEDAIRISALDAARAFFGRVLGWVREGRAHLPDAECARIQRRAAELALSVGDYEEAFREFEHWLGKDAGVEESARNPVERARAYGGQAEARFHLGDMRAAIELHEKALGELGLALPRGGAALFLYIARQTVVAAGQSVAWVAPSPAVESDPRAEEAIARLVALTHAAYYEATFRSLAANLTATNLANRQPSSRSKAQIFAAHAAVCLAIPGFAERFQRYGDRGIAVAEELGDAWAELYARSFVAMVAFCRADWARVHAEAALVDGLARRVRDPAFTGLARQHVVYAEYCTGNLSRCVELSRQLRAYYETYSSRRGALDACFFLPQALLAIGDVDEAERVADWQYAGSVALNNQQGVIQALVQKALVALSRGDPASARTLSVRACDLARTHVIHNAHVAEKGGVYLLCLAAARCGAPPDERPGWPAFARGVVEVSMGVALSPTRRAFNLWALSRATSSFGLPTLGSWLMRRAVAAADTHGTRLDGARARAELGRAELDLDPGSASGADLLSSSAIVLRDCGATRDCMGASKADGVSHRREDRDAGGPTGSYAEEGSVTDVIGDVAGRNA